MASTPWDRLDHRITTYRKKTETIADQHGMRAVANLDHLRKLQHLISELIDDEIIRGRDQGAQWGMLGTSKQQAQQRYRRVQEHRNRRSTRVDPA